MPLTHAKVSAISDSGSASLVQPSDWNAGHVGTIGSTRQSVSRTSGAISFASGQTTSAEISSALRLTIAATTGDVLQISMNGIAKCGSGGEAAITSHTFVSGAITNACSPGTRPLGHGYVGTVAAGVTGTILYVVQAGDIVSGNVTITPTYQNSGTTGGQLYADSVYGFQYTVVNLGHL